MSMLKDLINSIIGKREEDLTLNSKIEFRLNKKEKILIQKYCQLRKITVSQFLREISTQEIDKFIRVNN